MAQYSKLKLVRKLVSALTESFMDKTADAGVTQLVE